MVRPLAYGALGFGIGLGLVAGAVLTDWFREHRSPR